MATINLVKPTKEQIVVVLTDLTDTLTDLAGKSSQFTVYAKDDTDREDIIQTGTPTVELMKAYCNIDTTVDEYVPGEYALYIQFTLDPEVPVLGPVYFNVN